MQRSDWRRAFCMWKGILLAYKNQQPTFNCILIQNIQQSMPIDLIVVLFFFVNQQMHNQSSF